jgi:hypothetical protein
MNRGLLWPLEITKAFTNEYANLFSFYSTFAGTIIACAALASNYAPLRNDRSAEEACQ